MGLKRLSPSLRARRHRHVAGGNGRRHRNARPAGAIRRPLYRAGSLAGGRAYRSQRALYRAPEGWAQHHRLLLQCAPVRRRLFRLGHHQQCRPLRGQLPARKSGTEQRQNGEAQLILIATDGELYGHHKPWRDKFLEHLVHTGAPSYGFEVCTLERYMRMYPATKEVELRVPSAWSCSHGVARWDTGCECTEGDSSWKAKLRSALNRLAGHIDQLFEQYASKTLANPWAARNAYLPVRNGWETPESFWANQGRHSGPPADPLMEQRTLLLLEAQYYTQCSFTSCGFFFEDLDRIEPRNNIAFARRAISLTWQALGIDLQPDFVNDLSAARSWRSSLTGADIYRQLPIVRPDLLPPLSLPPTEEAEEEENIA